MAETITGLRELNEALQQLPAAIERNVMRGALRAGGKVLADEARRLAPVAPPGAGNRKYNAAAGDLRDSIRVSMRVRSKAGWVNAQVKAGGGKNPNKAWYARLVEFGTARHWIRPKNRKSLFFAGLAREAVEHPGARPKPFMRPAFDARWRDAVAAAADYIRDRLPRELRKAGK